MSEKNKLASSLGLFLRLMYDLMVLNVLWLLCCLPVFTFGPASSALSRVMITLVRGGSEAVAKNFFLAFRRDFGRAVVLGLIGLLGLAIAVSDILFALSLSGGMKILFLIVAALVCFLVFSYLAYIFALHAFFENSRSATPFRWRRPRRWTPWPSGSALPFLWPPSCCCPGLCWSISVFFTFCSGYPARHISPQSIRRRSLPVLTERSRRHRRKKQINKQKKG